MKLRHYRPQPRRGCKLRVVGDPSRERRPGDTSKDPEDQKSNPSQPVDIRPVQKKVGEDDDNLKRREKWFRRRTGSPDDQG